MAQTADLDLVVASSLIQLGLIIGLVVTGVAWRMKRLAAGLLLLVLVPIMSTVRGPTAWMMVTSNAAGVIALVGACTRGTRTSSTSWAYPGWLLGAGLLFVFLFGFYSRFEAPLFWTFAGRLLVLLSLGIGNDLISGAPRVAVVIAGVSVVACAGSFLPAPGFPGDTDAAPIGCG
ncbi:MAG: hypothetical protein WEE89_19960 [Gemmatimonadota bacterium]